MGNIQQQFRVRGVHFRRFRLFEVGNRFGGLALQDQFEGMRVDTLNLPGHLRGLLVVYFRLGSLSKQRSRRDGCNRQAGE